MLRGRREGRCGKGGEEKEGVMEDDERGDGLKKSCMYTYIGGKNKL